MGKTAITTASAPTIDPVTINVNVDEIKEEAQALGFQHGVESGEKAGYDKGLLAGAEQERARIQGIEALAIKGHEDLIQAMKYDGHTTPEQAAVKMIQEEKSLQAKQLETLYENAPAPLPPAPEVLAPKKGSQEEVDAFVAEQRSKGLTFKAASILAEKEFPEFFQKLRVV